MTKFNQIQLCTDLFESKDECFLLDLQSRCVCSLFARLARESNIQLPRGWGVCGEFLSNIVGPEISFFAGVYLIREVYDVREFSGLQGVERKRYFLVMIMRILERLSRELNFDLQPFSNIAEKIDSLNFLNVWEWKKGRKYSATKKFRSRIHVIHELDYFELVIHVLNKKGEIHAEKRVRPNKIPDEIIMANTLGDLVWLNDDEIELISKLNLPQEPPIRIRLND